MASRLSVPRCLVPSHGIADSGRVAARAFRSSALPPMPVWANLVPKWRLCHLANFAAKRRDMSTGTRLWHRPVPAAAAIQCPPVNFFSQLAVPPSGESMAPRESNRFGSINSTSGSALGSHRATRKIPQIQRLLLLGNDGGGR
jgi:hypothetical protein